MDYYMLENKIKQLKKIEPKKIIYPVILFSYFGVIALFLFFSLKFFTVEINRILTAGADLENAQNQPALDLAGYNLLEKKFKLVPASAEQLPVVSIPDAMPSSSVPILGATTTSEQAAVSAEQTLKSRSVAPLTISIFNSTRTAGLAGKLKNKLEAAGWPVAAIGNLSPVISTTTLNLSPEVVNHPDLSAIKSVLVENGLTYIENLLPTAGSYDLEIIIGGTPTIDTN